MIDQGVILSLLFFFSSLRFFLLSHSYPCLISCAAEWCKNKNFSPRRLESWIEGSNLVSGEVVSLWMWHLLTGLKTFAVMSPNLHTHFHFLFYFNPSIFTHPKKHQGLQNSGKECDEAFSVRKHHTALWRAGNQQVLTCRWGMLRRRGWWSRNRSRGLHKSIPHTCAHIVRSCSESQGYRLSPCYRVNHLLMQLANRNNRHYLLDHQHNSSMIDRLAFVLTSDSNSVDVNTETYVSRNIIQYRFYWLYISELLSLSTTICAIQCYHSKLWAIQCYYCILFIIHRHFSKHTIIVNCVKDIKIITKYRHYIKPWVR